MSRFNKYTWETAVYMSDHTFTLITYSYKYCGDKTIDVHFLLSSMNEWKKK